MEIIIFNFNYHLPKYMKVENKTFSPVEIEEDGFQIKIYCPSLDPNNKQQLVKIQISKSFESIPDDLSGKTEGIDKLSQKYFLITKDLIRLHTRQFLFDKPQINAIKQISVTIRNQKEDLLSERATVTAYIREEDSSELTLNQNIWYKINEYIKYEIEPESYFLILLNAKYNAFLGNFREAILLSCVAIEEFAISELDCDKKAKVGYRNFGFVDFFYEMVNKITKKDLKEKENSYYHLLTILFEARNNIAHGKGCYFKTSCQNYRIIAKNLKTLDIEPNKVINFDAKACLTLVDKTDLPLGLAPRSI